MNLFETAVRNKYRFYLNGRLSTEDLWDLTTEQLDKLFKTLNKEAKLSQEESLLNKTSKEEQVVLNKIEIVKHVVTTKLKEKEDSEKAMEMKQRKQRIMEIISSKQDDSLKNMSVEELEKLL